MDGKISALRDKISRFIVYVEEVIKMPEPNLSKAYLEAKSGMITKMWDKIERTNDEIEESEEETSKGAREYLKRDYETAFTALDKVAIRIQAKMEKYVPVATPLQPKKNPTGNDKPNIKLKAMDIPSFSGDYDKWISFRNMFDSLVHNKKYTDLEKIHYLKSCLDGEAERVISQYDIKAESYVSAYDALVDRFHNEAILIDTHIIKILSQPKLRTESGDGLKEMMDVTSVNIQALKGLNIQIETRDPILLLLLVQKLDDATRRLWEQNLKPKTLPTMKQFLDFLKNRFHALGCQQKFNFAIETTTSSSQFKVRQSSSFRYETTQFPPRTHQSFHTSARRACPICSSDNHSIFSYEMFRSKEPHTRIEMVSRARLCNRCLRNHQSKCNQPDGCRVCGGYHHTFLHSEQRENSSSNQNQQTTRDNCTITATFPRALQPDYADGISAPRRTSDNGTLPSARKISTKIHRPSYSSDPNFTVMLAVFRKFLDHDITATALNQGQDGAPIDCCDPTKPVHPECFPVEIGPDDPNFIKYNVTRMNFIRSAPAPTGHFGPREQLNQATAFIDGSVVYAATDKRTQSLRSNEYGLLRMYNTPDNRTLLPVSTDPKDGCNEAEMNAKGRYCFESGDTRANENLHLTSMHVIWARQHNFLESNLHALNPEWTNDIVFEEAKRILGAQLQHITYNEFLPVLLGREYSKNVGILADPESRIDHYDPTVDASFANVFAACAFRFPHAHTLLPSMMKWTNANSTEYIELHKMLFNPYSLWGNGGLDSAITSAIQTNLAKSDQYFTTQLTDKLFEKSSNNSSKPQTRNANLDLVSLNIQRGRDHGLPAYHEWRKYCNLPTVDSWDTMQYAVDADSLANMKTVYKDAVDVDLYTGALSEKPMEGAIIGALLSCLITDQFLRIKKGDSHWYERSVGPQRFSADQLKQIYNTTLASIICRNSDAVEHSQPFVMQQIRTDNEVTNCQLLDTFDFSPWVFDPLAKSIGNFVKVQSNQIRAINVITNTSSVSEPNKRINL